MQIGCVPHSKAGNAWARYGRGRPHDPANAIPAATRYLVDHGARRDLDRAIFAYNHSWTYVAKVKQLAGRYASGLLMLLDAYRLTGRLPLEVQVQASRLRHAVKLVIQAEAARSPALVPPSPAAQGLDPAAAALRAWIAAQPWAQPGPVGWVYLLCFRDPATGAHRPLRGNGCRGQYAGHYWGWTDDLIRRIAEHRNPRWRGAGRLVQVALEAGLTFELAWLEYPATRGRERRLKNQGSAYRRCPLCRGTGGPLDPAAAVAAINARRSPQ